MNTVDIVRKSHQGDTSATELLQRYSNLGFAGPDSLASAIASQSTSISDEASPHAVSDDALVEAITTIHRRAGTMTEVVSEEIDDLRSDAVRLRFAHQPDLLPYRGVMAQFVHLNAIQERLAEDHDQQSCQLYFVVDHDISSTQQFRATHFPDPFDNQGLKSLSLSFSNNEMESIMESVPSPDCTVIQDWINTIRDLAVLHNSHVDPENAHGLHPDRISENVEFIRELLDVDGARSVAEFNMIVTSRIVNDVLGLPTLFVPLSSFSGPLIPHYEYLLSQWSAIRECGRSVACRLADEGVQLSANLIENTQKVPVWHLCPSCDARLRVTEDGDGKLECTQYCHACGTVVDESFGTMDEPDLSGYEDRIAPRVIMDNLLDVNGFDVAGGVGYESSVEHALLTHGIAREMGWSVPVECYWRPSGLLGSPTEAVAKAKLSSTAGSEEAQRALELIYNGRATVCYDLVFEGENALNQWKRHFEEGGDVATPITGWQSTKWFSPPSDDY